MKTTEPGFTLFNTALGFCGIAWSGRGVTAVQLPEPTETRTVRRLLLAVGDLKPGKPPAFVSDAIKLLARHLAGKPQDLRKIRLDLTAVPPFHKAVYQALRHVRAGHITCYAALAAAAGSPRASRAVGQAMAKNPFPLVVPCHRVLTADGKLGGFSAHGGVATKKKILALEGVG